MSAGVSFSSDMPVTCCENTQTSNSKNRRLPCKHTLRTISIAAHALPSEMSAIVKVESLDTKLPMNDTEDVLSETEGTWREDAFERSESG